MARHPRPGAQQVEKLSLASQSDDSRYSKQEADEPEQLSTSSVPTSLDEERPDSGDAAGERPDDGGDDVDDGYELPLDQVFEILKNSRRRETLRYLQEHDGNATLSDLAEHIAALENDTTVRAISSSQRKRVYVGLYQCHLPKMDDTDVVAFDQNRGTIELGANAEQLEAYLQNPDHEEWHKLYIGVALAGAVLFTAGQMGAASYGLTPAIVLFLILFGVTGCAIFQFWQRR